jgi:hypothetical protein|tara:strand:+ start:530 stop:676 length:147 start_codon:yes stop_codon:yes gene_type:complete
MSQELEYDKYADQRKKRERAKELEKIIFPIDNIVNWSNWPQYFFADKF